MIALAAEDFSDLRRWLISAAVIVLAHGGIAGALVRWQEPLEPADPSGAIVIDFAPEVVAPTAPETKVAPGPERVQSDAVPEKPIEEREEKPEEKVEAKGEEIIEQKVEPKTVPEPPRVAVPETTAPQPVPERRAALPAAPTQAPPNPNNSAAVASWKMEILALLERKKRYPSAAQARREQGIAQVSFTLDRQGRVIESRVVRSSGAADLDEEALAMLHRAQPFPPWPPHDFPGERVNLTVPIRFTLK
jgi:periplasmic protein TonB